MTLTASVRAIYNQAMSTIRSKVYLDDSDTPPSWVQVVALHPSASLPGYSVLTPTQTLLSGITTASALIVAANTSRQGGYLYAPNSNTDGVYISHNSPATTDDIYLPKNGVYQLTINFGRNPISNAIYARSASGTQQLILISA